MMISDQMIKFRRVYIANIIVVILILLYPIIEYTITDDQGDGWRRIILTGYYISFTIALIPGVSLLILSIIGIVRDKTRQMLYTSFLIAIFGWLVWSVYQWFHFRVP